jgi:hypothetical protein
MSRKEQVEMNYKAFQELLPNIPVEFHGKFALMKDGKIVGYFDTALDAYTAGQKLFKDEPFSIQEVIDALVDLGFFSHAISQR